MKTMNKQTIKPMTDSERLVAGAQAALHFGKALIYLALVLLVLAMMGVFR